MVVGTSRTANGEMHAFLYQRGKGMIDLGTLGGRTSSATGISDAGYVVGTSETADRKWHAFVWDGKTMTDIGKNLSFGNSFATSINNKNQVVGNLVEVYHDRKTFIYEAGASTIRHGQTGLFQTNMITDSGAVVGSKVLANRYHAYLLNPEELSLVEQVKAFDWWSLGQWLVGLALLVGAGALVYRWQRKSWDGGAQQFTALAAQIQN